MLYWSVDGGVHWQPRASLGRERVQALAVDGVTGDLYIATLADVRCATASTVATGASLSPQERYASGRDDLRYTILTSLQGQAPVTAFGLIEDTLYVGTRDGGLQLVLVDRTGRGVWPWETAEGLSEGLTLQTLCGLPGEPESILAGSSAGLYASADGGRTWFKAGEAVGERSVLSLCAPAALPETVLAGTAGSGVWISRDAGLTWSRYGVGLSGAEVLSLTLDDPAAPRWLYAGTRDGLWRLPVGAG